MVPRYLPSVELNANILKQDGWLRNHSNSKCVYWSIFRALSFGWLIIHIFTWRKAGNSLRYVTTLLVPSNWHRIFPITFRNFYRPPALWGLRVRRGAPRPRGWAGNLAKSKEKTHTRMKHHGKPHHTAVSTHHWLPPRNMYFPPSRQCGPICGVLIAKAVIRTLILWRKTMMLVMCCTLFPLN